ncbi:EAP30/Vps36 vacuolar sorting-associated protein [Chloropicon primus]|uniref:Vacuolar protein sorting-associated protein n=1 Tax=Chloropicon primus TaxID=1764295 RepID=A0A5B8MCA1_9CHLO|nr:EAP30/Vps36 vacuolar sorting-associated protein [Chloropicon primus]UPQ97340.1 EAP30/Vps36 vacuolar sorting-associated protein [Chloropicon primus]|eukprot:QDZ18128.1 EAP30/Vps36 vacuolar sorting-associated protein [Chloropicon primus]
MHGLKQKQTAKTHYRQVGEQLASERLATMEEQLSKFRKVLEDFAFRHKEDIKKDPIFRKHFHEMCASIGVDPLASNKGMWSELLGFGDFYYELGVQAVEACMAERPLNGGLMEIEELVVRVNKRRGHKVDAVSKDDVVQAIRKLGKLGSGFKLLNIGTRTVVQSVPGELNRDHNQVLSQAESQGGWVRGVDLEKSLGFTPDRVQQALQALLNEGQAWVDDGHEDGERRYWFPYLS